MNGVDISEFMFGGAGKTLCLILGVLSAPTFVLSWFTSWLTFDENKTRAVRIVRVVSAVAVVAGILGFVAMVKEENNSQNSISAAISEHYEVDYPSEAGVPKRGSSKEIALRSTAPGDDMEVYRSAVVTRSEDDVITIWVSRDSGLLEMVEPSQARAGISQHEAK